MRFLSHGFLSLVILAFCAPSVAKTLHTKPAQIGRASWYGKEHNGKRTASGQIFNMNDLTAAHRTLPMGSQVRVTNLRNGKSLIVRINDRGPYAKGRIIDVSAAAAKKLGIYKRGTAKVKLEVLNQKK